MTLLIPLIRMRKSQQQSQVPSLTASKNSSFIPEDSILASIRTALARWRAIWMVLRTEIPSHEWATMGFCKNGYNFWLVAQLLITKKDSVDVAMRMEVKCEDKLKMLKVLLQDEND